MAGGGSDSCGDGDHFWIKVTAGDIANGVLGTLCARLGPAAPACKVLVDVIIRWYEDNHPSHGVWGEIYNTGHIRVILPLSSRDGLQSRRGVR